MRIESTSALIIEHEKWHETLAQISTSLESYFLQSGNIADHRNEKALKAFLLNTSYGSPIFQNSNRSHSLALERLDDKGKVLDLATEMLNRDSLLEPKSDKIIAVAEEIILNALISAPSVAAETNLSTANTKCHFILEWNPSEIWIHGQDPHGVFLRKNFQKSFRPVPSEKGRTHGHSGRGLEIIVNSSTDLYIKSNPNWGTWVAARIDLVLSNRENDRDAKRLLLDFK